MYDLPPPPERRRLLDFEYFSNTFTCISFEVRKISLNFTFVAENPLQLLFGKSPCMCSKDPATPPPVSSEIS